MSLDEYAIINTMIVTLKGIVTEKLPNSIVIDVSGVGYQLLVPLETYTKLNTNDEAKVYVYEHIRENVYDLYGFLELDTKNLFEQLINVNGVGPKVGLSILSVGSVNAVRAALASGDIKLIQSAPGVGKRVAERLLVDLKDKVGLVSTLDASTLLMGEESANQDEAVQALVALGFTTADALIALKPIDKELSLEQRVKLALRTK